MNELPEVTDGYYYPPRPRELPLLFQQIDTSLSWWYRFRERHFFLGDDGIGGFNVTVGPMAYYRSLDWDDTTVWHELHIFNWRIMKWTWSQ